jgi:hypothetical protein
MPQKQRAKWRAFVPDAKKIFDREHKTGALPLPHWKK